MQGEGGGGEVTVCKVLFIISWRLDFDGEDSKMRDGIGVEEGIKAGTGVVIGVEGRGALGVEVVMGDEGVGLGSEGSEGVCLLLIMLITEEGVLKAGKEFSWRYAVRISMYWRMLFPAIFSAIVFQISIYIGRTSRLLGVD